MNTYARTDIIMVCTHAKLLFTPSLHLMVVAVSVYIFILHNIGARVFWYNHV